MFLYLLYGRIVKSSLSATEARGAVQCTWVFANGLPITLLCQWSDAWPVARLKFTWGVIHSGCTKVIALFEGITKFILKGATTATSKSSFVSISMICMSLPQMFKQALPPKKRRRKSSTPLKTNECPVTIWTVGEYIDSKHRRNSGDIWPHPAVTATRLRSSHIDPW